jgi:hypothetical protein
MNAGTEVSSVSRSAERRRSSGEHDRESRQTSQLAETALLFRRVAVVLVAGCLSGLAVLYAFGRRQPGSRSARLSGRAHVATVFQRNCEATADPRIRSPLIGPYLPTTRTGNLSIVDAGKGSAPRAPGPGPRFGSCGCQTRNSRCCTILPHECFELRRVSPERTSLMKAFRRERLTSRCSRRGSRRFSENGRPCVAARAADRRR